MDLNKKPQKTKLESGFLEIPENLRLSENDFSSAAGMLTIPGFLALSLMTLDLLPNTLPSALYRINFAIGS